jgi:hypothetical protein
MIAWVVAAALQSDFVLDRELGAEEVAKLRDRLDAWGEARGVEAFRGFGRQARIDGARERPVYRIRALALDEGREVEWTSRPYEGRETLVRSLGAVDRFAPPTPEYKGFESRQWRLPVEGSARTLSCPPCRGEGQVACSRCRGQRRVDCERCRGAGTLACSPCGGTSKVRCTFCFGFGGSGAGSRRRTCSSCSGQGKRTCGACASGKVRCGACSGNRKQDCGPCRGKGRQECVTCRGRASLVETLEIVISLRPRTRDLTVTELPGRWRDAASSAEHATWSVPGEEAPAWIGRIPNPALAAEVRRALAEARAAVVGRRREETLRVTRVACGLATLRWEEIETGVALIDGRLHFDRSPAAVWAERQAELAERSLSDGHAAALARAALRADPDCGRARRVLDTIAYREAMEARPVEVRSEEASLNRGLLAALFALAGLIALVMLALKIYLWRRRAV